MRLRVPRPANLAEHLTLGSATGIVAATGLWLLVAGLAHVDADWARAAVAWLVEDVSFAGFVRDVMTGGPLAGALFTLLFMRQGER